MNATSSLSMVRFDKLVRILVVSACGVFALAGCSVDAESTPPADAAPVAREAAEENTGKTADALKSGGGGGLGFSCGALGCICNGDWDCNNMFGSGACGTWPAKCYQRGPSQYCICAPWVNRSTVMGAGGVAAPSGGVLAP